MYTRVYMQTCSSGELLSQQVSQILHGRAAAKQPGSQLNAFSPRSGMCVAAIDCAPLI